MAVHLSFKFENALENRRCKESMSRSLLISDHFKAGKVHFCKNSSATNLRIK